MAKFCGNCGAKAEDNEKFCGSCGAKFDDPVPAPSPVPEPATEPASEQTDSGFVQADTASGGWSEPAQQTQPTNDFQQADNFQQTGEFQQAGGFRQTGGDANGAYNASAAFNDGGATAPAKSGKSSMPIIIAAAIVVVIVLIIVLVANRSTKIDAQELFKFDFTGPDGYGSCDAVINIDPEVAYGEYGVYDYEDLVYDDDEKFSDYFSSKSSVLKEAYGTDDKGEAEDMRDALLDYSKKKGEFGLSCELSKESGLKNGDTVTVTVKYDEDSLDEVGIKLENTSFEVTVEGLEEAETIDPFDGYSPSFDGYDGDGEISYPATTYSFVNYYVSSDSSSYNLSNGDTVTIEAYLDIYDYTYLDNEDTSKGFWFEYDDKTYVWPYDSSSTTQEFTVEGLKELTEVDPFDGMTFEYSGASPFLSIDSAVLPADFAYSDEVSVYLDIDYGTRFKVGDTFTVQVYAYSSLQEEGVKIVGTADSDGYYTKEFTVGEDAPVYVDSTNAADAEAALSEKIEGSVTDVKQDLDGTSYVSGVDLDDSIKKVKSMEKVDSYIAFNNATSYDNIGWNESINEIIILYKITATLDDDSSQTFYCIFELLNVYKSEGVYTTDYDIDISYVEKKSDAEEAITGLEGYTVTKTSEASATTSSTSDSSSATDTSSASTTSSSAASSSSTADSSSASASTSSTTSSTSTSSDTTSSEMVP